LPLSTNSIRKTNQLLYILALLKIIIPYFLQNPVYEPHRDEFLYLAEGHHLAWGFMEVPPLLSVFAWLTNLFGGGIFWVKLWPSLFGAATFILAGKIVVSLGGRNFALVLLFLAFMFSAYLRVFFLFQPNAPEIFFWTMIAFSLVRFTQTSSNKWLYVFGISAGLGMLSKYSVAFFTTSALLGLLLTKYRSVFLNKHFWYAAVIRSSHLPSESPLAIQKQFPGNTPYEGVAGNPIAVHKPCQLFNGSIDIDTALCICLAYRLIPCTFFKRKQVSFFRLRICLRHTASRDWSWQKLLLFGRVPGVARAWVLCTGKIYCGQTPCAPVCFCDHPVIDGLVVCTCCITDASATTACRLIRKVAYRKNRVAEMGRSRKSSAATGLFLTCLDGKK
jgi:hypothetical protein